MLALKAKVGGRNEFRGAINGALTERLPLTPTPGGGGVSDMGGESGRLGQAYNEQAFRYFLAIERKRSERSGHPFLLLLVDLKEQEGASASFHSILYPEVTRRSLFHRCALAVKRTIALAVAAVPLLLYPFIRGLN